MNGVLDSSEIDLDSLREYVIPKLLGKRPPVLLETPEGRLIIQNIRPQVEVSRKFCPTPDVRRTSSYPDITKHPGNHTEAEIKLQHQRTVNTELKRLLVASVGDALAARLEKVANEKALLNEQVTSLTKQVASDAERIESLSIEGDIWKSKFLAARVVVTELSTWKDSVTDQLHKSQTNLRTFAENKKTICNALYQARRRVSDLISEAKLDSMNNSFTAKLDEANTYLSNVLHSDYKLFEHNDEEELSLPPDSQTLALNPDYCQSAYKSSSPNCRSAEDCFEFSPSVITPPIIYDGVITLPSELDCTHSPGASEQSVKTISKTMVPSQSYNGCKKSMFVHACKSCAEREIIHL